MNKITGMRGLQLFAGSALLMFASLSHAQYVWVDDKGVKQFSDRAPPGSVPLKNILKTPRGVTIESGTPATPAAAPAKAAAEPKMTLADREADYKKRQSDKAEADKKAANEAANAAHKKAVCDAARLSKAQLDSGIRIRTGVNGDFMDDKQRAQENTTAKKTLSDC